MYFELPPIKTNVIKSFEITLQVAESFVNQYKFR